MIIGRELTANQIPMFEAWGALPAEWPEDPAAEIRRELRRLDEKVVVLDDDPTGTQTIHGIPVLTDWTVDSLRAELENSLPAFYILTNSRSMALSEACELNRQVAINLSMAARCASRRFAVISRSDSTLRGHFPGEVEALIAALDRELDVVLLIPFFLEGGRFTFRDVHYVCQGRGLVPAGQTEFARDPVFGYRASNLREWVEEKTGGRRAAASVASISLDDIRLGGPDNISRRLQGLRPGSVCIVNCVSLRDLEVFTLGLLRAELGCRRFLCRTAASFAAVRSGLTARPLLSSEEVSLGGSGGGLIVVGSYVPRTASQLRVLLHEVSVEGVELDVAAVLDPGHRDAEVVRVAYRASRRIEDGKDVAIYTSRELVKARDLEETLSVGQRISAALVDVVRFINSRPRYVLAKGGITSSDIATRALHVKRAMVLGQILPGVPVWELGPESRYPGLSYVVFPGNVGDADSLAQIVRMWSKCPAAMCCSEGTQDADIS